MGKRSVRKDKNIYQLSREALGLTRDKASEQMDYLSPDRIEKIESNKSRPHPDEILAMAECYKRPGLCNYYCSHECPIGMRFVPEVEDERELSGVVLEMLSALNSMEQERNRLIDISVDGTISEDEYDDFRMILGKLERISHSVETFKLWIQNTIASGEMKQEALSETKGIG